LGDPPVLPGRQHRFDRCGGHSVMNPQLSFTQELLKLPPPILSGSGSESESQSNSASLRYFVPQFRPPIPTPTVQFKPVCNSGVGELTYKILALKGMAESPWIHFSFHPTHFSESADSATKLECIPSGVSGSMANHWKLHP